MGIILSNGTTYTGSGSSFSGNYEDLEGKPTVFGPSGPKAKEGFVPSPSTTAGTTKYLREDGTWAVPPDTDTTYSDMKGATASAAGEHGLAPAPSAGAQNKYLTGGATYQNVDDHAATFTSTDIDDGSANAWTNVAKLTSGEKHSSIFNKLSTMFKNVRYLYRMLGTTDISGIGDGTVTGAIRELNTGRNAFVARLGDDYGPVAITPDVDATIFESSDSWIQKKNGIVVVHIYGRVNTNAVFTLLTLPKGLRPWAHVHADGAIIYNDIGNVSSSGTIQDNGLIKISGQAGKWISFTITYPA